MAKGKVKQRKGVVRGRSAAFLITVGVHVALLLFAGWYTAMVVLDKKPDTFEGKNIERPKMDLKKLKVPVKVKKIRQPKFNNTVAPPKPQIDLANPKMGAISSAMDALGGDGFSLGFGMDFGDVFGQDQSFGNELVGTFYDLKQKANRMPTAGMDERRYTATLKEFVDSSWDEDVLEEFFQAEQKKYTSTIWFPVDKAEKAPLSFKVQDKVQPRYWVIHYKGKMIAPEAGNFRFVGMGDDVLIVRAKKKVVLDACWPVITGLKARPAGASKAPYDTTQRYVTGPITDWQSDAEETGLFPLVNRVAHYGDWIKLRRGEEIELEVLVGESPGGEFSGALLIEQEGKPYRTVNVPAGTCGGAGGGFHYPGGTRKVLPVFKLAEVSPNLKKLLKVDPNHGTFDGPTFGTRK